MREINPDDKITADAIKYLAEWALDQIPPLAVIAACDRALWWASCHDCNDLSIENAVDKEGD